MKLTEDMVVARSRGAELNSIRKLNCWGSEISDVAVVRKLPNIEVLALSVNNISTLADFQHCQNLSELYIRQNNIQDLNEVVYLKELPKLKALWLADNPCAKREGYRLAILRALPHLQKLDNAPVESEEVHQAMIHGEDLVHPQDAMEMQRQRQQQQYRRQESDSRRSSHASSYGYQQQQPSKSYSDDPEPPPVQQRARSPDYYPPQQQSQQQHSYSQQPPYRESSPPYYEASPSSGSAPAPSQYYEDRYKAATCPVHRSPSDAPSQRNSFSSYREPPSGYRESGYREEAPPPRARRSVVSPERQYTPASDGDGYRGGADPPASSRSEAYSEHSHSSLRQYEAARPKRKSPNVLSAVLCLIKELDLHGLEVVDTAVRCRIQELED
ncbi:serine/arginine repetitive matrix protein 1-like isoform X2 [Amphibalanus amphitrite]|uniref:serine/arginine repetitive matrix protein 1-like isoform X2 n=1 Tax=Amphibalanus amphitrite TaxID=1232801 RepID=UPI001C9079B8|nr:serine/arginine repetitive matrix protein 1-like isoform X2 [Amphibalanus amphitrite]XP_043220352.1 serine/arginine repetitive matrix protein 1-like isoform X2 [Amphibalanus amphitrite]XP_043220353.1 serine/arginine repetitive matrix protein 1-like isoform X2 [Amphibalanus amphitrite]XP_043220354.1 serine/arginine repetitive matrix protein 1-like isoform X2 [Amphibalanus amphitrite]